jgi:hypothetical protein
VGLGSSAQLIAVTILGISLVAAPAGAFRAPELSPQQQKTVRDNFALSVAKLKGPYTENFCVCADGRKIPVRNSAGQIGIGCKDELFCAAYRAAWAEALAKEGMYIGNIFSRDVYLWDTFPDHNDLVRGYILEKYFVETHPNHKLSQLRAFGGLSGAEYETAASARFYERYLSSPEFNDTRDFLLAYELQRRFFLRSDVGQLQKVRNLAVRIHAADRRFKPLRDAVHNQISAGLLPKLAAYRDSLPPGSTRSQVDELIAEITKITSTDVRALQGQVADVEDTALRAQLSAMVPAANADPVNAMVSLGQLMALARQSVAARQVPLADARRLIDVDIIAAAELQRRGSVLVDGPPLTVKQNLQVLAALTDATFGVGLLSAREREAAATPLKDLMAAPTQSRETFAEKLQQAERVVEWAQANATLAFAEVLPPWELVLPQVAGIRDDILRGSPLMLYASVARRLDDFAAGGQRLRHELFGSDVDTDVRALNPGLAVGVLRVAPKHGSFTRDEIVALPETPADLDPAAGILTQGEGNMLSHVQLLARALGIPNVVLGPSAFTKVAPHDGKRVFFIVTPGGRVILKEVSAMTEVDRGVYEEYTRNQARAADGSLGGGSGPRLHIDRAKVDLSQVLPIDLRQVRRSDSGRFCGPKAAYLGELKHVFPDHVARGLVVPFGAYYQHYQNAPVAVPETLRGKGLATPGEPLPGFVERTYKEFFDVMVPAKTSEKELNAWITPRLEIIRYSIGAAPLSAELREAIRAGLQANGLMTGGDQTVGCFVRSDTNVEDLDNFNGAGLNLTVFNRKSLDDIYSGLKEVWASPFQLRSFSWRQTLIDDPLWVLSSVVILEAIPSEKSGVLVTADPTSGEPGRMLVATSEGVGGAVDGTSAETLLWSPQGVELVTLFKSPWRNQLQPGGGTAIVPASGSDTVLAPAELQQIVGAGQKITETFTPVNDPSGRPRPWDIEFGFASGKLWLFQCRPFLGNDQLKNVPALAPLEGTTSAKKTDVLSLEEKIG